MDPESVLEFGKHGYALERQMILSRLYQRKSRDKTIAKHDSLFRGLF
jgi:hypothetical protein